MQNILKSLKTGCLIEFDQRFHKQGAFIFLKYRYERGMHKFYLFNQKEIIFCVKNKPEIIENKVGCFCIKYESDLNSIFVS